MEAIILNLLIPVLATVLVSLLGVFGAKITSAISKKHGLETVALATDEVIKQAMLTVGELQQTTVEGLKAAHDDGKLTKDEIKQLGDKLLAQTHAKLADPAKDVLAAANVDINALIKGAAEDAIATIIK